MFARVKLVPVQFFSRSSSGGSEGNFSETPDFSHHVRCLLEGDDVDFISGFVGSSESAFRSEFCFEQIFLYGRYDWCHGFEMEGGDESVSSACSVLVFRRQFIDLASDEVCPFCGASCGVEDGVRNGLSDIDVKLFVFVQERFVGEEEHGEIDFQSESFAPGGDAIEAFRVLSAEEDGDDGSLRFDALLDERFVPRQVLNHSLNLS